VRRLLMLLRRLALREGATYVFEPHDDDFRAGVVRRFEIVLLDLFRRGAFAGLTPREAFEVVGDASVNPPFALEAGRFVLELRVAPARPLEHIAVRLVHSETAGLTVQAA